jgi:hypothetical protein
MDEGVSEGAARRTVELRPLVLHDPKAAGELRRLRSFVKKLAAVGQAGRTAYVRLLELQEEAVVLSEPRKKGKR